MANMVEALTALQVLALSKLTKENAVKAVRSEVDPGSYPAKISIAMEIDGEAAHIEFDGALTVAADGSQRPTSNLLSLQVLALLFQRMGIQKEAALNLLREVATEFLSNGQTVGEGVLPYVKDFEGFVAEYGKMLEALPRIPKKGSVSLQAELTVIGDEPAKPERKIPTRTKVA